MILLLLVVCGHVFFMASPLHASGGHRPDRMVSAAEANPTFGHGETSSAARSVGELGSADHCALEWIGPAELAIQLLLGLTPAQPLPAGAQGAASARLPAHGIGPPLHADRHALLQVFRF